MAHDDRSSRRLLPAAFLLALLPAAAGADVFGRYDFTGTCNPNGDGFIAITSDTIEFYEASCAIRGRREVARGVRLDLTCEGEGQTWEDQLTMRPAPGGVILVGEDEAGGEHETLYRRCD